MKKSLDLYLNHHLASFSGTLVLIDEIAARQQDPAEVSYFHGLAAEVRGERELLRNLLVSAGLEVSNVLDYAGEKKVRGTRSSLVWQGIAKGEVGVLEALEVLALSIQSKRLLWKALAAVSSDIGSWRLVDFESLEASATRQRNGVEDRRMERVKQALWHVMADAS